MLLNSFTAEIVVQVQPYMLRSDLQQKRHEMLPATAPLSGMG